MRKRSKIVFSDVGCLKAPFSCWCVFIVQGRIVGKCKEEGRIIEESVEQVKVY